MSHDNKYNHVIISKSEHGMLIPTDYCLFLPEEQDLFAIKCKGELDPLGARLKFSPFLLQMQYNRSNTRNKMTIFIIFLVFDLIPIETASFVDLTVAVPNVCTVPAQSAEQ